VTYNFFQIGEKSMYDNSLYSSDKDDTWRYTLGKPGKSLLLTIGLNPSTATREKADTTVAKVEQVALRHGFDGFAMLNLYPVRATDYRSLSSTVDRDAFHRNLDKIEEIVASQSKPVIWAAWGASIEHHPYFLQARNELFSRLARYGVKWVRFGALTAQGHPRHPSRLQYAWEFAPYEVN
jgi:hypothetical protein